MSDYEYIDQDARPAVTDDGPHSSMALTVMRDNLAVTKETRPPMTPSWKIVDTTQRSCGIWPVVCHVQPVWVHEPVQSINVHLRIDQVTWTIGLGVPEGSPDYGAAIYVTTAKEGILDLPPRLEDGWVAPSGEQLALTGTAQTVDLVADCKGRSGWVDVLVWIWSVIDTVPETSGTVQGMYASGGLKLTSWSGAPSSAVNPWERAIMFRSADVEQADYDIMDVRQIAWYSGHTSKELYPVPLVHATAPPLTGADEIDLYGMGVVVFSGVTCEIVPNDLPRPARELFYSSQPIEQTSHHGQSAETLRMGRQLIPQHGSGMTYDYDAAAQMPWFVRSDYAGNPDQIDDDWQAIAATPAAGPIAPSADRDGLRAKVIVAVVRSARSTATAGEFFFRIAAYTPGGALIVAGPDGPGVEINLQNRFWWERWGPIAHTMWGLINFKQWQFRGCLLSETAPNITRRGHDWFRCNHVEMEMDETDLTYPCVLKIEVKRADDRPDVDLACVAYGFARKELDA